MTNTCSSRGGCVKSSQWSKSAMPKPTTLWSMATTQKSLAARSSTCEPNNLYGWAMSHPLPTGVFRRKEDCEQLAKTIADHPADDPEGFIHKVDLEYPEVQKKWMSEYQHILLGVGVAPTEVEKLVPNLYN